MPRGCEVCSRTFCTGASLPQEETIRNSSNTGRSDTPETKGGRTKWQCDCLVRT